MVRRVHVVLESVTWIPMVRLLQSLVSSTTTGRIDLRLSKRWRREQGSFFFVAIVMRLACSFVVRRGDKCDKPCWQLTVLAQRTRKSNKVQTSWTLKMSFTKMSVDMRQRQLRRDGHRLILSFLVPSRLLFDRE